MADPIITALIRQGARRRGLDPAAVLAVASVEGLGGGVGDAGHAFGPFQLNDAGGVLTGRPGNHRAFAESPRGINWALDRIAHVARGLHGDAAIRAIVTQFERPAAPGAEIAKARSRYGNIGGGSVAALTPAARPALDSRSSASPDLTGLFNLTRSIVGLPESAVSLAPPTMPPKRAYTRQAAPSPGAPGAPFKMKTGKTINFLTHFAQPFGVQVTSTTGGHHVKNSWHYKGRAIDVSGSPARMMAVAKAALSHPQDFLEVFYDPLGVYVKNGKVIHGAIGGHSDHVHLAA